MIRTALKVAVTGIAMVLAAGGIAGAGSIPYDSNAPTTREIGGSAYYPITPRRVLDTRLGVGISGALGPGATSVLAIGSSGAVPTTSVGVMLNVTVADATDLSFITVWPASETRPEASSLNPAKGIIMPNAVVTRLDPSGNVAFYNAAGTVHLVGDVVGYFVPLSVPKPTVAMRPSGNVNSGVVPVSMSVNVRVVSALNASAGDKKLTVNIPVVLGPEMRMTCGWAYNTENDPTDRWLGGQFSRATSHTSGLAKEALSFTIVANIPVEAKQIYPLCVFDRSATTVGLSSYFIEDDVTVGVESVTALELP